MQRDSAATVGLTLAWWCSSAERITDSAAAQEVLALSVRDAESIRQDWVSIVMGNFSPGCRSSSRSDAAKWERRHG